LAGGTLVTFLGTNFQSGASVTFGAVGATSVTFVSATTLRATAPSSATAQTVGVTVTNPDAQAATLPSAFTYNAGTSFYTVTPCRVVDTRNPTGSYGAPALAANGDRAFTVTGQCGIPATARAVSANVTITQPTAGGDLRLSAAGGTLPLTSSINYRAGQTRANDAVIPLGASGGLAVHCDQPSGTVQFIIDVNGYFQ
jgi:IPT/TIG domain